MNVRGGFLFCVSACRTEFVLRFFEGGLKILFGHLHFLLKEIDLRLNGSLEIFRRFLESFDRLSNLSPNFR